MIHPIPDFCSPEKTAEKPPAISTASIPQNTSAVASNSSHQENTSTMSVWGNLSRTPKTTSLKSLIKNPESTSQPVNESIKQSAMFTEEELIQCWDDYSETLEAKAHLKNTMINCKPVLLDNFVFEVRVHNPAQEEELLHCCLDLLKIIRGRLKNDLIQITIRIDDKIEKKTAYTAAEKIEFLNNINPLLTKLIDEFDLVID